MTPMEISPLSYILNRTNCYNTNDEDCHFNEDNHTHKINSFRDEIDINDLNNNHNFHNNTTYTGHREDHIVFNSANNSKKENRENDWKVLFDPSGNK